MENQSWLESIGVATWTWWSLQISVNSRHCTILWLLVYLALSCIFSIPHIPSSVLTSSDWKTPPAQIIPLHCSLLALFHNSLVCLYHLETKFKTTCNTQVHCTAKLLHCANSQFTACYCRCKTGPVFPKCITWLLSTLNIIVSSCCHSASQEHA